MKAWNEAGFVRRRVVKSFSGDGSIGTTQQENGIMRAWIEARICLAKSGQNLL